MTEVALGFRCFSLFYLNERFNPFEMAAQVATFLFQGSLN